MAGQVAVGVGGNPPQISKLWFYTQALGAYYKDIGGYDKVLKFWSTVCRQILLNGRTWFSPENLARVEIVKNNIGRYIGGIALVKGFITSVSIGKDIFKLHGWAQLDREETREDVNYELLRHTFELYQDITNLAISIMCMNLFLVKEAVKDGIEGLKEVWKACGDTVDSAHSWNLWGRVVAWFNAPHAANEVVDHTEHKHLLWIKLIKSITSVAASVLFITDVLAKYGLITLTPALCAMMPQLILGFSTISIVTCIWSQMFEKTTSAQMRAAHVVGY